MLCPRISNDFPIVYTIGKRSISNNCAEVVVGLAEEQVAEVSGELHIARRVLRVPCELHIFAHEAMQELLISQIDSCSNIL